MLAQVLQRIGAAYPLARTEPFTDHPLAKFIRDDARDALQSSEPIARSGLICKGSAGNGNFAAVPWLALFDPLITTTARDGYYLVFLYSASGYLYLSLNQGTTAVRQEFRAETRKVLVDRAEFIRARLHDFSELLPVRGIELGSFQKLPRDYEAGHALGQRYRIDRPIDGERLIDDLTNAVSAYRALIFRGGLDASPDAATGASESLLGDTPMSLTEVRQYRFHRRIERNPRAAAMAKLVHGTTCQACGFNFRKAYGELGEGYIEAHHLVPLGTLDEGVRVELDAIEDFVALCSNCHRMIHRLDDPSDIGALRALLKR